MRRLLLRGPTGAVLALSALFSLAVAAADPGAPGALRIFNDWPRSWDAAFTLLAHGAFVVSSSMEKGQVQFVQVQSRVGGECRLRNPWPGKTLTLYRNGEKAEDISGSLLAFPTARGETITAIPKGTTPARKEIP